MKICFLATFSYPLFHPDSTVVYGGAELDLFYIAQELKLHEDFDVSFITGDFGQPPVEHIDGLDLYRSFRTTFSGIQRILYFPFALCLLLLALKKAAADIYIQEGAGLETAITAWYCRLTRRVFVYRVASTIDCDGTYVRSNGWLGRAFLAGLRQAKAIVTEDQEEVDLLRTHYQLKAQAIYDTTPLPADDQIASETSRRHILWVGRLVQLKRAEIYIDLARRFSQEKFIMIAPADDNNQEYQKKIKHLAETVSNLQYIPGVRHDKLDDYYRYAKLLINTSDFEGYPNTFIEAGKYGVPILALGINPDNILADGRFGNYAQGDITKLAAYMTDWLSDPNRRDRAGMALRDYVKKTNDMKKNIVAYIDLFTRLTRGK